MGTAFREAGGAHFELSTVRAAGTNLPAATVGASAICSKVTGMLAAVGVAALNWLAVRRP